MEPIHIGFIVTFVVFLLAFPILNALSPNFRALPLEQKATNIWIVIMALAWIVSIVVWILE